MKLKDIKKSEKQITAKDVKAYGVSRYNDKNLREDGAVRLLKDKEDGEEIEVDSINIIIPKFDNIRDEVGAIKRSKLKEEQYWEKPKFPNDFDLSTGETKYLDIIIRELERVFNGCWFYNNGKPFYLTGNHYFFLVHYKMDDGNEPEFRISDAKYFYHWEACVNDPRCDGQIFIKNRRSGFSNRANSTLIRSAILNRNSNYGIVSKTGEDAQKMFSSLVSSFMSLPFYLQPEFDGTSNPKKSLELRERSKAKKQNFEYANGIKGLNNTLSWKNTTDNAYDGYRLKIACIDEAGKFENRANIKELFRIIKTTTIKGKVKVGKILMGSTVNKGSKGGESFVELFNDSTPLKRVEVTGKTSSGMYGLFIPAQDAYEGCIDIYGYPVYEVDENTPKRYGWQNGVMIEITTGSLQELQAAIDALGDDQDAINEQKRQFPRNLGEAFRPESGGNSFNIEKIVSQLDFLSSIEPQYEIGDFYWIELYKTVGFKAHKNGRFKVLWRPEQHKANMYEEMLSLKSPLNKHEGIVAIDPVDHSKTTDSKRFSYTAMHVFKIYDYDNDIISGNFVLEYLYRHDNAIKFYEDVLMVAMYYGYKILIENQKIGIKNHLQPLGFINYFEKRPENSLSSKNIKQKEVGVPMNDFVASVMVECIEVFIDENVGYNPLSEDFGKMMFEETLKDWLKFEFKNRTAYDLTISSGLALMWAMNKVKKKIAKEHKLKINESYTSSKGFTLARKYKE